MRRGIHVEICEIEVRTRRHEAGDLVHEPEARAQSPGFHVRCRVIYDIADKCDEQRNHHNLHDDRSRAFVVPPTCAASGAFGFDRHFFTSPLRHPKKPVHLVRVTGPSVLQAFGSHLFGRVREWTPVTVIPPLRQNAV
jgi:hypothetical protein